MGMDAIRRGGALIVERCIMCGSIPHLSIESEVFSLVVTKHAQKRLKERCGVNKKSADRMAKKAYELGMTHSETTGNLKKWVDSLYFYNETANQIRLYGDKAYIFHNEKLITVIQIPHNLMKFVVKKEKRKK